MFLRKITKSTGRTYYYILKSVHDKKKGYCVHKIIADVSKLPGNVITVVKAMLEGHKVILSPKLTGFFKIRKGLVYPAFRIFWIFLISFLLGLSPRYVSTTIDAKDSTIGPMITPKIPKNASPPKIPNIIIAG